MDNNSPVKEDDEHIENRQPIYIPHIKERFEFEIHYRLVIISLPILMVGIFSSNYINTVIGIIAGIISALLYRYYASMPIEFEEFSSKRTNANSNGDSDMFLKKLNDSVEN
ncbi:MAG: hypothetical protein ABIE07_04350 [Candidatus Zixiibacteriota bacterium]